MTVDWAEPLASFLATYWLHSTLLLGLVWLVLTLSGSRSPALQEYLWKAAAVIGLLTALLQTIEHSVNQDSLPTVAFDVIPRPAGHRSALSAEGAFASRDVPARMNGSNRDATDSGTARSVTGRPAEARAAGNQSATERLETRGGNPEMTRVGSPFDSTAASPPGRSLPVWAYSIVGAVAAAVLAGGLLRLAVQSVAFRRRYARCRRLETGRARDMLDHLMQRAAVRRPVTLLVTTDDASPASFGWRRWRILLPEGVEHRLSCDELQALLAHELAHLVRGDTLWLGIGRVLCSCFAFQPLNLCARRGWQRAAERRCDAWAVRQGIRPLALARCLIRVTEWRLVPGVSGFALSAEGVRSNLTERIEALLHGTRTDRWDASVGRNALRAFALAAAVALAARGPMVALGLSTARGGESSPSSASEPRGDGGVGRTPDIQVPSAEIDEEFRRLHRELRKLEADVARLGHTVIRSRNGDDLRGLVRRLRTRMAAVRQRRDRLWAVYRERLAHRENRQAPQNGRRERE